MVKNQNNKMENHLKNAEIYVSMSKSIFGFYKSRDDWLKDAYKEYVILSNLYLKSSNLTMAIHYLEKACNLMFSILNYDYEVVENYVKLINLSRYLNNQQYIEFCEKGIEILENKKEQRKKYLPQFCQGMIIFYKSRNNVNNVLFYYLKLIDYYRTEETYKFSDIVSEYVGYCLRKVEDYNLKELSELLYEAFERTNKYMKQRFLFESILLDICNGKIEEAKVKILKMNSIIIEFLFLSDLISEYKEDKIYFDKTYSKILDQKWYNLVITKHIFEQNV